MYRQSVWTECIFIMNITKHALRRMAERGFTSEMLVALMKGEC